MSFSVFLRLKRLINSDGSCKPIIPDLVKMWNDKGISWDFFKMMQEAGWLNEQVRKATRKTRRLWIYESLAAGYLLPMPALPASIQTQVNFFKGK